MTRRSSGLVLGLLLLMLPGVVGSYAQAGVITWVFQGATFDDGGTLSGSFQFDGVSTFSNINIVTTAGTKITAEGGPLAAYTFTDVGTYLGRDGESSLEICVTTCNYSGDEVLLLYFGADATDPGLNGPSLVVPIDLAAVNNDHFQGRNFRLVTAGDVFTTPEPSSVTLCVIGCLGFWLLRRRISWNRY
jgi:hypothetical protein